MKQFSYNQSINAYFKKYVCSFLTCKSGKALHRFLLNSKSFMIGLVLFLLLLSSTCNDKDLNRDLTVKNNYSDSICTILTEIYPDTTIDCRVAGIGIGDHQEYKLTLRNGWQNEFNRIGGVLQVFIIDKCIWRTEPCDTIKKYNKILKRYQLTLDDVEKMNWTITYP
jgi:hypothetical protein